MGSESRSVIAVACSPIPFHLWTGSVAVWDAPKSSGVTSADAGSRKSNVAQPISRRRRPKTAITSFLGSNASLIAAASRNAPETPIRSNPARTRRFFDHPILPRLSNRSVRIRVIALPIPDNALRGPRKSESTASPSGDISQGPTAAGKSKVSPNSSRPDHPSWTSSHSPASPMRMVKRS